MRKNDLIVSHIINIIKQEIDIVAINGNYKPLFTATYRIVQVNILGERASRSLCHLLDDILASELILKRDRK